MWVWTEIGFWTCVSLSHLGKEVVRELIRWSMKTPTFHCWLLEVVFHYLGWDVGWWLRLIPLGGSHSVLERRYLHVRDTFSSITVVSEVWNCTDLSIVIILHSNWGSIMIHFLEASFILYHAELWRDTLEVERGHMDRITWGLRPRLNVLHYRLLSLEWGGITRQLLIDHVRVWSVEALLVLHHLGLYWRVM